jgi:ABC-type transport system involved in cytochrome c biogenesis ATPase subunit
MRAELKGAALGQLRSADLDLAPGRYVVLANEGPPLWNLIAVLAGREPPRSGHVLLDGAAPARDASVRRKVAALFADEALPPAKTVLSSLGKALAARGAPDAPVRVLSDAGLSQLADVAPGTLGPRETRSVALALALSHDGAALFALHEPLTTLVHAAFVLERLDEHTARGALVLTATTSPADATLLGGQWLCVELGRLRSLPGATTPRLGAGPWQQVLVETSDRAALSQALRQSPHGLKTELGASQSALKVMGPALDITVHELVTLARQHQIELFRIEPAVPPVEALMAARAGFARAAYEASRLAAQGGAR